MRLTSKFGARGACSADTATSSRPQPSSQRKGTHQLRVLVGPALQKNMGKGVNRRLHTPSEVAISYKCGQTPRGISTLNCSQLTLSQQRCHDENASQGQQDAPTISWVREVSTETSAMRPDETGMSEMCRLRLYVSRV